MLLKDKSMQQTIFPYFKRFARMMPLSLHVFMLNRRLNRRQLLGAWTRGSLFTFHKFARVFLPFRLGRTTRGFRFSEASRRDLFGRLFCQIGRGCEDKALIELLIVEYAKHKEKSCGDLFGFRHFSNSRNFPAWALVLPWEPETFEGRIRRYEDSFLENRQEFGGVLGAWPDILYSDGNAMSQVLQSKALYHSILDNGLFRRKDLPKATILSNGAGWCWLMDDAGNHRAYVCNQLGIETLEVQINRVVFRNEVQTWPNVIRGGYTVEEALMVFDQIFEGLRASRGVV